MILIFVSILLSAFEPYALAVATPSDPTEGQAICNEQVGSSLLQQGLHRSILQDTVGGIFLDLVQPANQTLPIDPGKTGLRKFWVIALFSYVASVVFTCSAWWWFTQRQKRIGADSGESSDDDSHISATPTIATTPRTSISQKTLGGQSTMRMQATQSGSGAQRPFGGRHEKDTVMKLWERETHGERLQSGALTLFMLSCTMGVYALLRLSHRPACAPAVQLSVHGPEIIVLSILVILAACCWMRPKDHLYWPALVLFFLYAPAVTLPPFNLSCTTLQVECKNDKHWRISEAVNHVDCSMQGQTAQQIFLTVFLLLPWLLPEIQLLHVMWVWLIAVYFVWSIAYLRYSPDGNTTDRAFTSLDIVTRFALLSCVLGTSLIKKYFLQRSQLNHFTSDLARREDSKKLYNILEYMLPEHVIMPMLMNQPIAESIEKVTILFIVIDDFNAIVKEKSPELLLRFLNQQFTKFDEICQHYEVTKIETIGEEYVCCVGVTPADIEVSKTQDSSGGHTVVVSRILKAASAILQCQTDTVKFKMGMHTGPVVAGVVAQKLPRYRIFGDTINTAARMMQKGEVGHLQFGEATHQLMPSDMQARPRGKILMKGKGEVETYLFGPEGRKSKKHATKKFDSYEQVQDDEDERVENSQGLLDTCLVILSRKETTSLREGKQLRYEHAMPMASVATIDTLDDDDEIEPNMSENTKFADVVNQMAEHNQQEAVSVLPRRKSTWFLSERDGFTPEMENAWRRVVHVDNVCKKIDVRLDIQLLGLFVVSVAEMLWNFPSPNEPNSGWQHRHENFGTWERLPIFLVCRVTGLFVIVGIRTVATSAHWFQDEPYKAQLYLVVASWILAITLYFSYDALITGVGKAATTRVLAPSDQIYSLVFVLLFCSIIRAHRFLFYHSLAFIPLALFIVAFSNLRVRSGVYFSAIGQVLFVVITISFAVLAHSEEQSLRARYKAVHAIKTTKGRVQSILETMMPPLVLEEVRSRAVGWRAHHSYESATLAQSDLCGFTELASKRTPIEVVQFIGDLFGLFDKLTDKYDVYKVETVGDAYIAGQAEEPLTVRNSPTDVIDFGVAMISAVVDWSKGLGVSVQCRVGVHHGEVIGGIVDKKMQRYHMFGKLMQVIEILESTAPKGGVQVSRACHDAVMSERAEYDLQSNHFDFTERQGDHLVTSKGELHTFEETGGRTFLITGPDILNCCS